VGENHRLRIIDCNIQRGEVAIKEVLNAKNNIDMHVEWQHRGGGRVETIYCALLIANYKIQRRGVAIKEVLNGKKNIC